MVLNTSTVMDTVTGKGVAVRSVRSAPASAGPVAPGAAAADAVAVRAEGRGVATYARRSWPS